MDGDEITLGSNYFKDVVWDEDNRQFVAVSNQGGVFVSEDAYEWKQTIPDIVLESPYTGIEISSIASNGSAYVAVGWKQTGAYGNNLKIYMTMYSSTDLKTWDEMAVPNDGTNRRIVDVIWNEETDEFFVSGTSLTGVSSDGVIWEFRKPISGTFSSVAYGNGKYVAVTGYGTLGKIYYSTDGINWSDDTEFIGPSITNSPLNKVRWTGGHFVIVGSETLGHAISLDGETWIRVPSNYWNNGLYDVVSMGDHFIAVGDAVTNNSGIYISGPYDLDSPGSPSDDADSGSDSGSEATKQNSVLGLILQVGPNSGNEFIVDLTDATTASLRVDSVDVKSRDHASQAIGKIDIAIQIISDERAKFGVYQNSLDHIANNVVNYNENMTASESRIRDADIASEMLKQVKYSILSQAVQAMLAQSNQQSSGVLNLLG